MRSKKNKQASISELITYTFPKLHTGKTWFVDFFCFDPVEGRMRRKKYHLDNIRKLTDRRQRAAELITVITSKLKNGWNVWADVDSSRGYTLYKDVCEYYVKYIQRLFTSGSLKESSYRSYLSYLRIFNEYLSKCPLPVLYIYQIELSLLSDFLDYVLLDREVSANTRNNYRVWLATFCGWMVEKQYLAENPVKRIKSIREEPKHRSALSPADLTKLRNFLEKENRHFLLACMMEYYTFIRPDELSNLRVGDIRIKEQKIFVSGAISKNRKDGMVGLNTRIIQLMIDLEIFKYPSSYFLFGNRRFTPGARKAESRIFREFFARKLRPALKWNDTYQFYSLKDAGIRDLANAEGIVVARDQARHADISTTNKYLKGDSLTVHEETKHFEGNL